ncbi:hypothetical protein ACQPYH_29610 [Kribbella sp. CA-245084]|uniref:hypothetical protein n=1 Tax=Kribbella sp. CA-245084 TaxID=3239940 RepID=UPI003D8A3AFB
MLQATNDVGELVDLCVGLPLALRIADAVASRGLVAALVSRMRRTGALAIDDDRSTKSSTTRPLASQSAVSAVSSAFQTSYDLLDPAVQRGFRLLSLFPGQELTPGPRPSSVRSTTRFLNRLESASLRSRSPRPSGTSAASAGHACCRPAAVRRRAVRHRPQRVALPSSEALAHQLAAGAFCERSGYAAG